MEKRKIEEESHYGKWMRNNQEQLMNNFWRALTERELRAEPEFIDREIKKRRLPVLADQPVCLIGVRVAREEQAKEALKPDEGIVPGKWGSRTAGCCRTFC